MTIGLETIDIILATASVVIFITVFFLVFKFRKKNKATKVQEKEVKESVVSAKVEKKSENIRDVTPEQIKMPETADLKLEDIFPEYTGSNKPEIAKTEVPEIQPGFRNEFSEKPADVKSSEHENTTDENVELKLEDEFPKTEIPENAELRLEDPLPEKLSDYQPATTKPDKKSVSSKKKSTESGDGEPKKN